MGTDIVNDKRSELTTTNLELTTTWTTKTTRPLATLSPLNVVIVVIVVVCGREKESGGRKKNLCYQCYLCDKEYFDDRITMLLSRLPRDPGCPL